MFGCGLAFHFLRSLQDDYRSGNAEAEADGKVWNTRPVTFEANAPTMRTQ